MSGRGEFVSLGIYEKALVNDPDWAKVFSQVHACGFDFVDLSIDETPNRSARLDWTPKERAEVLAAARDAGVQIGALCLSVHRAIMPGSRDLAMRRRAAEVYQKGIGLARDLNVSVLQVAGYYAYYEKPDSSARERYIDTLAAAVPLAAQAGIILAIENVDGNDISSIQDAVAVIDEINSPWVQIYPDIGNIAEHGGDTVAELRAGEGHMVALHVKDVLPGQPRRIPFGTGVADFDAAFVELARQRWTGRMMLEMWNDDAPDSLDTCTAAKQFIETKLAAAQVRTGRQMHEGERS